jgi:hypothetical protein
MMISCRKSFVLFSFLLVGISFPNHSFADDVCADLKNASEKPADPGALSPENKDRQQAGKGLSQQCSTIVNTVKQIQALPLDPNSVAAISKGYEKYVSARQACIKGQKSAATVCLEGWSPNLAETAAQVNVVISTLGAQATNESCGKFADVMKIAQAGLTAYSAACGAMKAGCGMSCVKSRNGLQDIQAQLGKAICQPGADPSCAVSLASMKSSLNSAISAELESSDELSVAGKASVCNSKYAALGASALAGVAGLLGAFKQGDACEQATAASTPVLDTTPKCAIEANATLPECICEKNPRSAGCTNSFEKLSGTPGANSVGIGTTDKSNSINSASAGLGGDSGMEIPQGERSTASDSSLAGAPQGSNPGLSGSSGGSGVSGASKEGSGGGSGLNTNILSGTGGGGGGSWGRGGGSSGGSGYREYLPGGKQDPAKAMAGQQAWTKEVTGQGGKSNFDKVKERYQDNRNTLLGN